MTRVYINEVEINVDDKIALNSAFNETLDTGVIIIPNSSELSIKRLDKAVIANGSNNRKYFRVGTVVKEYETFERPYKYKYTVELVSPTIILQIPLPNIAITQPLAETGVAKRSIYYQINRLVSVFAPELTISEELKQLTENIVCPENQYNRKTLLEILNDLLINVPAVATVLEGDIISCIRLDEEGTEIDHNKIINIVETKKIDEYCSEIEMSAENVVENKANTMTDMLISPRSEEYIMTTDNAQLILDKPIYRIEKVEVYSSEYPTYISYRYTNETQTHKIELSSRSYDITKYVLEDSIYNTKLPYDLSIRLLGGGQLLVDEINKYKRSFLSYTQGSNVINNLTYREKGLFGTTITQYPLEIAFAAAVIEYAITLIPNGAILVGVGSEEENVVTTISDPRTVQFKVTYISQSSLRFRVKKPNSDNTNEKVLIDNQSNSYVDSSSLWNVELENAKRIGNPELKINMVLKSMDEIPQHPAKFEDYVMTNYVVNIYQDKVLFEGYFTKDFIRKNLYTGLKSKARWTSIAKGSEALSRRDLIIIDHEFKTTQPEIGESSILSLMVDSLTKTKNNLFLAIRTIEETFRINPSVYQIGNNIVCSFDFKDNFNVGMYVDSIKSSKYVMAQVPYVDVLGEFENLTFSIFNGNAGTLIPSLNKSQNLPKFSMFNSETGTPDETLLVMKDNREIYGADIQLRFNSNDEVIIYDEFINHFLKKTEDKGLFYFGFATRTLTKEETNIEKYQDGEGGEFTTDLIDAFGNISQPTWQNLDKEKITCWGICNTDYDVLLVCNSNAEKIYEKKGGIRLC